MDFFGAQDRARKQTKFLVLAFIGTIIIIVSFIYALWVAFFGTGTEARYWDTGLYFTIAGPIAIIIVGCSLVKIAMLKGGGGVVARSLGGSQVDPSTTDPLEKRLINVVEEMAIASGVTVPEIYILSHEPGINGFAAGYSPNDAAVAVTRGCLEGLTRDELQGVIAHEFSHILNGDMRLNIRMMGILYGIFVISVLGRFILEVGIRGAFMGRRSSRDGGGAGVAFGIMAFGGAVFVLGWVGILCGQMIQCAISRQREFLADAAAVQFTRNPQTIAGALRRIGAGSRGSVVQNAHALDAAHMLFANGLSSSMKAFFSTHPPIDKRIKAVDPGWDGSFLKPLDQGKEAPRRGSRQQYSPTQGMRDPHRLIAAMGHISASAVDHARQLHEALPSALSRALHHKDEVYLPLAALILDEKEVNRPDQYRLIQDDIGPEGLAKVREMDQYIKALGPTARLPILNLAIPTVRRFSQAEFKGLMTRLDRLSKADKHTSIFEYVMIRILNHSVGRQYRNISTNDTRQRDISLMWEPACLILSALAYCGATDLKEAQINFHQGMNTLPEFAGLGSLVPFEEIKFADLDRALDTLGQATFPIRKRILEAAVETVTHDNVTTPSEAELLRAIAISIDCPIPRV